MIAAVALIAGAYQTGLLAQFSELQSARRTLLGLGGWGQLAFVVAYMGLQPFGVPGTIFVFVAPLIWPFWTAFALSMTGTMCASVVGFSFARFVAREWISQKIPSRFAKYNDALEHRAFATVALLRLIFWMPPLLHAFFGVSKVRFWTHLWGSFVGYIIPLLLTSYFGPRLMDVLRQLPLKSWVAIALVALFVVVLLGLWRLRARYVRGSGNPANHAGAADPQGVHLAPHTQDITR